MVGCAAYTATHLFALGYMSGIINPSYYYRYSARDRP